jgi:Bacterial Ig-like domain (group 3)
MADFAGMLSEHPEAHRTFGRKFNFLTHIFQHRLTSNYQALVAADRPQAKGDANYTTVDTGSLQQIIPTVGNSGTQPVNISVNLGKPSFSLGERSSFSVAVAPATKGGTALPTGTVTLFSSSGQISGQAVLAGGKATGIVEWDAVGTQGVYAVYAGDTNFAVGSSAPVSVNVAQGVPTVTLQPRDKRCGCVLGNKQASPLC